MLREALALWRGPALADLADYRFAGRGRRPAGGPAADARSPTAPRPTSRSAAARALVARARGAERRAPAARAARRPADRRAVRRRPPGRRARRLRARAHAARRRARRPALARAAGRAPGRRCAATQPRPAAAARTNLPAPVTSFVGREREIEQHRRAARAQRGWSRSSAPAAPARRGSPREARRRLGRPRGRRRVDGRARAGDRRGRDRARRARRARPARGRAAATARSPPRDGLERLLDVLADRETILVLDNCEHLIAAVAELADRLLGALPAAAHRRHQPRGAGDRRREPRRRSRRSGCRRPGASAEVALAAPRGPAVRRPRAPPPSPASPSTTTRRPWSRSAAASTASRSRSSSPPRGCARCRSTELAERLDDRFRLLTGGSRTALPRHRTLRAVVDWSWELLTRTERRLARRLAVFTAGATDGERGRRATAATCSTASPRWSTARCCRSSPARTRRATGCSRRSASTGSSSSRRRASWRPPATAHARYFAELAETRRAAPAPPRPAASGSRCCRPSARTSSPALRWLGDSGDARGALHLAVDAAVVLAALGQPERGDARGSSFALARRGRGRPGRPR